MILLLLLLSVSPGRSIICLHCADKHSINDWAHDSSCGTKSAVVTLACPEKTNACFKIISVTGFRNGTREVVTRGCFSNSQNIPVGRCEVRRSALRCLCSTDYCNGARRSARSGDQALRLLLLIATTGPGFISLRSL